MSEMKRPFVICHLISSLDGRISGGSFYLEETIKAMDEHWKIRAGFECDAVLNGAVTAAEIYADGYVSRDSTRDDSDADTGLDFVAETDLDHYVVCLDPEGTLKWSRNYVDREVMPRSHVIEVLTDKVLEKYVNHLRGLGISYIFAGSEKLDVPLMMDKLVQNFGIERLLVTGGGITDWKLLEEGMVDEVSVIITPTISGDRESATLFDDPRTLPQSEGLGSEVRTSGTETGLPGGYPLELIESRELDGGAIHLRYKTKG